MKGARTGIYRLQSSKGTVAFKIERASEGLFSKSARLFVFFHRLFFLSTNYRVHAESASRAHRKLRLAIYTARRSDRISHTVHVQLLTTTADPSPQPPRVGLKWFFRCVLGAQRISGRVSLPRSVSGFYDPPVKATRAGGRRSHRPRL